MLGQHEVGWGTHRLTTLYGQQCAEVARLGEDAAAGWLVGHGYRVLARNVRFRRGELDIVAVDGNVLVFVEVKTRRTRRAGLPQEAVHPRKQAQIRRLATAWMKVRFAEERACRFDVIAVSLDGAGLQVDHIRGAF